jgi:hypothetical protein
MPLLEWTENITNKGRFRKHTGSKHQGYFDFDNSCEIFYGPLTSTYMLWLNSIKYFVKMMKSDGSSFQALLWDEGMSVKTLGGKRWTRKDNDKEW